MLNFLKKERWSPYTAGFVIALLAISSLFLFHKTIGVSTTFVKLAALFWLVINPEHLQENPYYLESLQNKAWIDWQVMLVFGIFLGAYLSAKLSHKNTPSKQPSTNQEDLNASKRYGTAFIGGIILMFGARLAGGCTSGHAITGGFQLAVSGWLFMMAVFALGIPTALFIHNKKS